MASQSVPLIDKAHNAWRDEDYGSKDMFKEDQHASIGSNIVRHQYIGRLFTRRRILSKAFFPLAGGILLLLHLLRNTVIPFIAEDRLLRAGLNKQVAFGTQVAANITGLNQISDVNIDYLPGGPADPHWRKRLIFIGDIHGCADELHALLQAVEFDADNDHIIHTGDVVAKGPDTPAVLDTLIKLKASGVRGNWEDRILLLHDARTRKAERMAQREITADESSKNNKQKAKVPKSDKHRKHDKHHAKHITLQPKHKAYLGSLPLILRIPGHPPSASPAGPALPPPPQTAPPYRLPPLSESAFSTAQHTKLRKSHSHVPTLVVHAGLVPAIPLTHQDPEAAMTMRWLEPSTHLPSARRLGADSVRWTRAWGWYQRRLRKGWTGPAQSTARVQQVVRPEAQDWSRYTRAGIAKELGHTRGVQWRTLAAEVLASLGLGAWVEDPAFLSGATGAGLASAAAQVGEASRQSVADEEEGQDRSPTKPSLVVYGHNSKEGVQVDEWTLGLDGGCVSGGRLTAAIMDARGWREMVSVQCEDYLS